MEYLPPEEEQTQLLQALASLIKERGAKPFLTAPIIEPNEDFFPDRWTPDEGGVENLAKRLLHYAKIGKLKAHVTIYDNPEEAKTLDPHGRPGATERHGAAAWFAGIVNDVCQFGAEESHLAHPEEIVACMCHEVAHAYRHYHQLEHYDRALEECLTDLTTVYLGFGVFSANAAYLYRSQVVRGEGFGASRYSHQQIGYLSPQSLCFLLAAQATARGLAPKEKKKLAGLLETNQRAYFKASLSLFEGRRQELLERLGLSQGLRQEARQELSQRALPAPSEGQFNLFLPVFRVKKSSSWALYASLSLFLVGLSLWALLESLLFSVMGFFAAFLAALAGRRLGREVCSDPRCGALLPPEASRCASCGGDVLGALPKRATHEEAVREALSTQNKDQTLQ